MPRRILSLVLALSGLLFSSAVLAICEKPEYPAQSMQLEQEGITVVGLRLRTDGTVSATAILHSSGFPALDQSAQRRLSGCVFNPPDDPGLWDGIWLPVQYTWFFLDDNPRKGRTARKIKRAVEQGDADAHLQLSLILATEGASDADRERALELLGSAAGAGVAHAQYQVGVYYEKGLSVPADLAEALRWYEKAAAQGHVLAIQRLKLGKLLQ
jgi:TonB family protein